MKQFAIGAALVTTVTAALGLLGLTGVGKAGQYEEPEYQVVAEAADYQVRQYAGWIEARVTVQASYGSSVLEVLGSRARHTQRILLDFSLPSPAS